MDDVNEESTARAAQLVQTIEDENHGYLRKTLPEIESLANRAAEHHGAEFPRFAELAEVVFQLSKELEMHMMKEEHGLFPLLKLLERQSGEPPAHLLAPIRMIQSEHREHSRLLGEIERLTDRFSPPPGFCHTVQRLYGLLSEMYADLVEHMRKEEQALFPIFLNRPGLAAE